MNFKLSAVYSGTIFTIQVCLVNPETQGVSDIHVKETLAVHQSDCGVLGDQQDPSRIYSGTVLWSVHLKWYIPNPDIMQED